MIKNIYLIKIDYTWENAWLGRELDLPEWIRNNCYTTEELLAQMASEQPGCYLGVDDNDRIAFYTLHGTAFVANKKEHLSNFFNPETNEFDFFRYLNKHEGKDRQVTIEEEHLSCIYDCSEVTDAILGKKGSGSVVDAVNNMFKAFGGPFNG